MLRSSLLTALVAPTAVVPLLSACGGAEQTLEQRASHEADLTIVNCKKDGPSLVVPNALDYACQYKDKFKGLQPYQLTVDAEGKLLAGIPGL